MTSYARHLSLKTGHQIGTADGFYPNICLQEVGIPGHDEIRIDLECCLNDMPIPRVPQASYFDLRIVYQVYRPQRESE